MKLKESFGFLRGFNKIKFYKQLINSIGKQMKLSNLLPDIFFLKKQYKKRTGKKLDLKNPKTFNEKTQWLKLHDRSPLHTMISDKYAVRKYISKRIGSKYLIPLIFHTLDAEEIRAENLPNYPFIIKSNHDSSGGIIIRDKSKADWDSIRKKLKKLLSKNYYYHAREWQYKNIKPRIIVEKLLMDDAGNIPYDYKVFCFNGQVKFIEVDINREKDHCINYYTPQWEKLPQIWRGYKSGENHNVPSPKKLDEMIYISETLSSDFPFLRVDLYILKEQIYFGELTLSDSAGYGRFLEDWDEKLGDMLLLDYKHKNHSSSGKLPKI